MKYELHSSRRRVLKGRNGSDVMVLMIYEVAYYPNKRSIFLRDTTRHRNLHTIYILYKRIFVLNVWWYIYICVWCVKYDGG